MWKILITLAVGILCGLLANRGWRFGQWLQKITPYIITGGLIFLLVSMGASLSSNPDVKSQIGQLGLQALILAAAGIAGSVLLVFILQKTVFTQRKGREKA